MRSNLFIFCVFVVFQLAYIQAEQTIGIFTFKVSGVEAWDPDSIHSGITGSEEAVIYMSQELAKLGFQVIVYGYPPKGSLHSRPGSNPRFVDIEDDDASQLDIAISWRAPCIGEDLRKRASKVFLWPHDTIHYFLSDNQINAFDNVLWLSEWQRQQWIFENPGFKKFKKIFGNGVNLRQINPSVNKRSNPFSCIYGSNYARGLEVLLDIWPKIKSRFSNATLDIYYGWQHWGLLSTEKEKKLRSQVTALASLGVTDHGLVGHDELSRAYESCSLWTYPCIATETFCITALRAQLAGALPVIIEETALKETVRNGFKCSQVDEYYETLLRAMEYSATMTLLERKKMGQFIINEYTWEMIAKNWKTLFDSTAAQKPVIIPKQAQGLVLGK